MEVYESALVHTPAILTNAASICARRVIAGVVMASYTKATEGKGEESLSSYFSRLSMRSRFRVASPFSQHASANPFLSPASSGYASCPTPSLAPRWALCHPDNPKSESENNPNDYSGMKCLAHFRTPFRSRAASNAETLRAKTFSL